MAVFWHLVESYRRSRFARGVVAGAAVCYAAHQWAAFGNLAVAGGTAGVFVFSELYCRWTEHDDQKKEAALTRAAMEEAKQLKGYTL